MQLRSLLTYIPCEDILLILLNYKSKIVGEEELHYYLELFKIAKQSKFFLGSAYKIHKMEDLQDITDGGSVAMLLRLHVQKVNLSSVNNTCLYSRNFEIRLRSFYFLASY